MVRRSNTQWHHTPKSWMLSCEAIAEVEYVQIVHDRACSLCTCNAFQNRDTNPLVELKYSCIEYSRPERQLNGALPTYTANDHEIVPYCTIGFVQGNSSSVSHLARPITAFFATCGISLWTDKRHLDQRQGYHRIPLCQQQLQSPLLLSVNCPLPLQSPTTPSSRPCLMLAFPYTLTITQYHEDARSTRKTLSISGSRDVNCTADGTARRFARTIPRIQKRSGTTQEACTLSRTAWSTLSLNTARRRVGCLKSAQVCWKSMASVLTLVHRSRRPSRKWEIGLQSVLVGRPCVISSS